MLAILTAGKGVGPGVSQLICTHKGLWLGFNPIIVSGGFGEEVVQKVFSISFEWFKFIFRVGKRLDFIFLTIAEA